jgi:hypothetical protein
MSGVPSTLNPAILAQKRPASHSSSAEQSSTNFVDSHSVDKDALRASEKNKCKEHKLEHYIYHNNEIRIKTVFFRQVMND